MLRELSGEIDALYAEVGRPSIPPERLLKAQLLIALYTVRSDRLFCQMLDYNILFRWFLDMSLEDAGLDQSNFSRLRERLTRCTSTRGRSGLGGCRAGYKLTVHHFPDPPAAIGQPLEEESRFYSSSAMSPGTRMTFTDA